MTGDARCPSCGRGARYWLGYQCPGCGHHFDRLYRREHRDPARARGMDAAAIAAEYREAGQEPVTEIYLGRTATYLTKAGS